MRRILAFLLLLIAISGTSGAEAVFTAKPCPLIPEDQGLCTFDKDGKRVGVVYYPHVLAGQLDQLRRELQGVKQDRIKDRQQMQSTQNKLAGKISEVQQKTDNAVSELQQKTDQGFKEMEGRLTAQQETIETNHHAFTAQMASLGGRNVLSLALGGIGILGMCVIGLLAHSNRKQSKTIHTELTAFVSLIKERIENEDRGKQDPPRPPKGNGRTGNTQPIDTRKVAEAKQKAKAAALVISGEPLSPPSGDATLVGSENLILIHDDEAPEEASAPVEVSDEERVDLHAVDRTFESLRASASGHLAGSAAACYEAEAEEVSAEEALVFPPSQDKTVIEGSGMVARLRGFLTRRRVASVA